MEKQRTAQDEEAAGLEGLTRLQYAWTVWENWQGDDAKGAEEEKQYLANMQRLAEFDNLISFWEVWHDLPHANPGQLFYGSSSSQLL